VLFKRHVIIAPLAELFSSFIVSLLPLNYRSTLAQPFQHTLLRVVPKVFA
jgi:hypothetical protein